MTEEKVRKLLRAECERMGSQRAYAERCGVTRTYLEYILRGERPPTDTVLKPIGLRRVVSYAAAQ